MQLSQQDRPSQTVACCLCLRVQRWLDAQRRLKTRIEPVQTLGAAELQCVHRCGADRFARRVAGWRIVLIG